jgi:tetratricopeptide (TPR) repeat protein
MATDTAAPAPRRSRSIPPDPTRHIWQVPLFLLGVAVFVATWQGWLPLGTRDPNAAFLRQLAALTTASDRVSPDREQLKQLLTQIAAQVEVFPEHRPAARFALGSGYARLAELTPDLDEARTYWLQARQHFDQVKSDELKDPADPPRLAFRSAKVRAAVGLPPTASVADIRLLIALLNNVPFGEEPGEAARLQADLALRIVPPDLNTARESLTRYLTGAGIATPPVAFARAKYQLGDIYFRLKQPDQARRWLEQIGPEAPPEVAWPARSLLARVRMAEADWLGAIREWETLRATPGLPTHLLRSSAFYLGMCKLNTREPDAAIQRFEEAIAGEGPEALAAAVRLAELYLRGKELAKHRAAVPLLERAAKGLAQAKDPRAQVIKPSEVQGLLDYAVAVLLADDAFEPALKVVELLPLLLPAGREREKRAEVLSAWANWLKKTNGEFGPKARAAAEEYQAIVASQPGVAAKAESLRRAASMYRLAGDPANALAVLQQATRLPDLPDALAGLVWYEIADALLAAGRPPEEIIRAFNEAMAAGGPISTTVRVRLARRFADTRNPGLTQLARALLEQIAKQETVSPAEQDDHERALVDLAHECIRNKNFAEAEVWLRKQLGLYGSGAEAPLGRLLLGICWLHRAASNSPNPPDAATAARLREEALRLFKQIVAEVDAKHKRDGKLSERDAWLRLQAALRVLQTYQQQNTPEARNELLIEADKLRERHRNTVEELIILSLMYHAFMQKNEPGKALAIRDQMKELFDRLPASAFPHPTGEYSRRYWEEVWFIPDPK